MTYRRRSPNPWYRSLSVAGVLSLAAVLPGAAWAETTAEAVADAARKGAALWRWLSVPVSIVAALLAGYVLARITRTVLARIVHRTRVAWDDALLARSTGPLTLLWSAIALWTALPWLHLPPSGGLAVQKAARIVAIIALFWGLLRATDIIVSVLVDARWAKSRPSSRALIPFGGRITKVLVVIAAGITALAELGYPIVSLVAGLGLGGLALALAAQKTVENLFGAFSLGLDQPFREGDFVKVEDLTGTVESVGLRSTRVRTLDRTLVTVPNGRLSEMRIESMAARDRIRLACTLGLVYGTTAAQMREIIAGVERLLREHPDIWPDDMTVRFVAFGASSLDITVMAWFKTTDWSTFQRIRQDVLLGFMEIVERAGSSFAFPTRTIHVVGEPASPPAPLAPPAGR